MRVSLTLFLVAATGLVPSASPAETPQARPNVLFIAVDDLNDWINCLGGRNNVHTPNLDRLAKRGVLLTLGDQPHAGATMADRGRCQTGGQRLSAFQANRRR